MNQYKRTSTTTYLLYIDKITIKDTTKENSLVEQSNEFSFIHYIKFNLWISAPSTSKYSNNC